MNIYGEEADRLIPVVFLVIVGTVAVYGLTISPLARYLGLAQPNPQGVLFLAAWRSAADEQPLKETLLPREGYVA